MQERDFLDLLAGIQKTKCETNTLEIKKAEKGAPKKLYDTLSSFSNQDMGGIIVFGVDESNDFEETGVYNANDLIRTISEQSSDMEPKVRPVLSAVNKDGKAFVCAEITSLPYDQRPCFYSGKGRLKGSYVRVGDEDLPMTEYEVYAYEAFRRHDKNDQAIVEDATKQDLQMPLIQQYLLALKDERPNLAQIPDEQILEMTDIIKKGNPTLSGLLMFGIYPQAKLQQLGIIATVIPGTQLGETTVQGERFLDTVRIEGTIKEMLESAMSFLKRNLKKAVGFDAETGNRIDTPEIPYIALREAILNALVHRDYSKYTEDQPIQIQVFTDRIVIQSPGGLYGMSDIQRLQYEQPHTRNKILIKTMETMGLMENRYSGIPTILRMIRQAGLKTPEFKNNRSTFEVVFYRTPPFQPHTILLSEGEKKLLKFLQTPKTRKEIADFLRYKTPGQAIKSQVMPLVEKGWVCLGVPDNFSSRKQTFYTNPDLDADYK